MNSSQSHLSCLLPLHMHAVIFLAGKWLTFGVPLLYIVSSLSISFFIYIYFFDRDATTVGLIKVRPTYPFGVDPAWHGTRSELPFLNSLKMKMSILLGVAQMNLGIVLSYCNGRFFRNSVNIW